MLREKVETELLWDKNYEKQMLLCNDNLKIMHSWFDNRIIERRRFYNINISGLLWFCQEKEYIGWEGMLCSA